jgi:hypothetical protein
MKYRIDEDKVIVIITALIALYDFMYLPLKTFLTTLIFVGLIYMLTKDLFFVALVLLVPNFILMINRLLGYKEKFSNAKEISDRIQSIKRKEPFVNPVEISKRVEEIKKQHQAPKVENVEPSDFEHVVSGLEEAPAFMGEDLGVPISVNGRIQTRTENTVPKVGTVEKNPLENPYVRSFDDQSIGIALSKTTNNNAINASDVEGVEI